MTHASDRRQLAASRSPSRLPSIIFGPRSDQTKNVVVLPSNSQPNSTMRPFPKISAKLQHGHFQRGRQIEVP